MIKLIVTTFFLLWSFDAIALSEYGRACTDNSDCMSCMEELECNMCMNNCWNVYGPAEVSTEVRSRDQEESCRIKWAKWCNAQCWDPDDKQDPDYINTKPQCSDTRAFPKYLYDNRPW